MMRPDRYDRAQIFRRLEEATGLIASHPNYPGKDEALRLCREDILEHESLTTEQRTRLLAILGDDGSPGGPVFRY